MFDLVVDTQKGLSEALYINNPNDNYKIFQLFDCAQLELTQLVKST